MFVNIGCLIRYRGSRGIRVLGGEIDMTGVYQSVVERFTVDFLWRGRRGSIDSLVWHWDKHREIMLNSSLFKRCGGRNYLSFYFIFVMGFMIGIVSNFVFPH
jgi:hypothetical protein